MAASDSSPMSVHMLGFREASMSIVIALHRKKRLPRAVTLPALLKSSRIITGSFAIMLFILKVLLDSCRPSILTQEN